MKEDAALPEADRSKVEAVLGHSFAHPELLRQALTHRSLAHERKAAGEDPALFNDPSTDNEQLEFLGDAVVGFLTAEALCKRYPELHEGDLTRLRAELVSRKHLGQIGARLELGEAMLLGRGEERSGGRKKHALLANCIEAVVAALYLDAGMEATRNFVLREIIEPAADSLRDQMLGGDSIGDYKSMLQEKVQAQKLGQPEYKVKAESGPDHRKRFLVEVFVVQSGVAMGKALARGLGNTKKKAEQEAARRALARLRTSKSETSKSESGSTIHE